MRAEAHSYAHGDFINRQNGWNFATFSCAGIPISEVSEWAMRKMWTSIARFSRRGKRGHFDSIVLEPPPMQWPHSPFSPDAGSEASNHCAARESYNLRLDQIASIDITIERVSIFREECRRMARPPLSNDSWSCWALQVAHTNPDREQALLTRTHVSKTIGDLASGAHSA
jgi:hypothetical protein